MAPNFGNNGNGNGGADRRRALDRLPEKMKAEEKAETRKDLEVRQKRAAPARYYESRCKVCNSQHRNWVEKMIMLGQTPSAIERAFEGNLDGEIPRRSVATHKKEHMAIEDAAMAALIEQEAQIEGLNIEEGIRDTLTKKAMFEIMMRKAYKDAVEGTTTIEPRDMIQMAKIIGEWEQGSATAAVEEARLQIQIFMQAIKSVFGPDEQVILGREVKRLRKMDGVSRELELALEPRKLEPAYVDAEVVQDTD